MTLRTHVYELLHKKCLLFPVRDVVLLSGDRVAELTVKQCLVPLQLPASTAFFLSLPPVLVRHLQDGFPE